MHYLLTFSWICLRNILIKLLLSKFWYWKIIVLGFYTDKGKKKQTQKQNKTRQKKTSKNTTFKQCYGFYFLLSMYEYKIKWRLKDEKMSEINLLLSLKSKLCMQKTVLMDVKRVLIDEQKRSLMLAGTNSSNLSHVRGDRKKQRYLPS